MGEFNITKLTPDGKDFVEATIQLDFNKIKNQAKTTKANFVPDFNKFEGVLGGGGKGEAKRYAEVFGHEAGHAIYALGNLAEGIKIQQLIDDTRAARKLETYPYSPALLQRIDATENALVPTETAAQKAEQVINGELRAH